MQGYIININRVKDEDLIVKVLTENRLKSLYRFYGARHSNINLGYKIDFEAISSNKSNIPMLRNLLHLGDSWMSKSERFFIWQTFIKLLYKHLKDIQEVDRFYLDLLNKMNKKISKQNPIRVCVESYIELLCHEGRLHDDFICFICEEPIEEEVVISRGFLPSHQKCIFAKKLKKDRVKELFLSKSSLYLSDDEVYELWKTLQEGF